MTSHHQGDGEDQHHATIYSDDESSSDDDGDDSVDDSSLGDSYFQPGAVAQQLPRMHGGYTPPRDRSRPPSESGSAHTPKRSPRSTHSSRSLSPLSAPRPQLVMGSGDRPNYTHNARVAPIVVDLPPPVIDITKYPKKSSSSSRGSSLFLLVVSVLAAGALIGFLYFERGGPSPTPAPVEAFTAETLQKLIQVHSPSTSFVDHSAPQHRAVAWLLEEDPHSHILNDALIQRFALVTVYFGLNGDMGGMKGWLTAMDECEWGDQVDCEFLLGKVVELQLGLNRLRGSIPAEIGLLTHLNVLDLSSNDMTGTIPSEIGLLTGLRELFLDGNSLTGTIPSSLCYTSPRVDCSKLDCDCCVDAEDRTCAEVGTDCVPPDCE